MANQSTKCKLRYFFLAVASCLSFSMVPWGNFTKSFKLCESDVPTKRQFVSQQAEESLVRWVQVVSSNESRIFAFAPKAADVFVSIKITGDNVDVRPKCQTERLVSRDDKDPIVIVTRRSNSKPFYFSSKVQSFFGNPVDRPSKNYIYSLPFQPGKSYLVAQGCRSGTHEISTESEFAIDFAMPEGSLVYSAREGVVVVAQDEYNNNGGDQKFLNLSNSLIIRHDDGTFANYGHLKHHGIYVRVGERVRKGQLIASSGNTGQSRGPHLHFAVGYPEKTHKIVALPITFETDSGLKTNLEAHQIVKCK